MAIEGQRMISKTQHYRKVTKPLLERKRRARMNHYLDELKDLIVETMEAQGEHVTKLEKADILEMTVQYLKTKKPVKNLPEKSKISAEKFRAGYTHAAYEVSKVFTALPGLNVKFGTKLMKHLGYQLKDMKEDPESPLARDFYSPVPSSEISIPPGHYLKADEPQGGQVWRPW